MPRRWWRAMALATSCVVGTSVVTASAVPPASVDGPAVALVQAERQQLSHIDGCPMFPADNPWNSRVDTLPVRARSAETIAKIQSVGGDFLHPDFGENPDYGIPYA